MALLLALLLPFSIPAANDVSPHVEELQDELPAEESDAEQTQGVNPFVSLTEDGDLYYHPVNHYGDRIVDYGGAGYENLGLKAIPGENEVPIVATVSDGASIQAAIDKLATLPIQENGFRGVILVKNHTRPYAPFRINQSGIIVRGDGTPTVLYIGHDTAIKIGGQDSDEHDEDSEDDEQDDDTSNPNPRTKITTYRVPTGSRSFEVEDASPYQVGDLIWVATHPNEQWIKDIDMQKEHWTTNKLKKNALRTITAIDGNHINIDETTTITIWNKHGGGYIQKAERDAIHHVGLEGFAIRGRSKQKNFAVAKAMGLANADDVFIRDIGVSGFQKSAIWVNANARRATLDNVRYRGAGETGGSQRYGFQVGGEHIFCYALKTFQARHAFVPNHTSVGGTVFQECISSKSIFEAGGHRHWSGSVLWDNCDIQHNALTARKYQGPNIDHGWRAVNNVAWNSSARRIIFQKPPHAYNIVCKKNTELPSLYTAQAKDREDRVAFREYVLGDYDNFTDNNDAAVDLIPVSPAWKASFSPAKGFDDERTGFLTPFTMTFQLNPGEKIIGAQLSMRMRWGNTSGLISIDRASAIGFETLGRHATPNGKDLVHMFDMANHLDSLKDGELNVVVHDKRACLDYAMLKLKIAKLSGHEPRP